MRRRRGFLGVMVVAVLVLGACEPDPPPPPPGDPVLLSAGDIAACDGTGDEATANVLDGLSGTVATLGDNVYEDATSADFTDCYQPSWGRHLGRTHPSAGNHEYHVADAGGYYGYFGAAAGDPAKGWYSYDLGAWHVVVVNSNCVPNQDYVGGCGPGSPQEQWLKDDLAAHPAACTLAYWHHPRWSSGIHGNHPFMATIWQDLYDAGADVVLSGHDHDYERFAPLDGSGAVDTARGIREFVVGTGGRSTYPFLGPLPGSEVRDSTTFGVLALTLHDNGYDWQFDPVAGATFTDSGSGSCH